MRILMLAPEPFFEPRGTPFSVYQRLCALSELGHHVDLLTYHVGQDINLENVTIHRTPPLPFIKKVKIGPSWAKLLLDLLLFFKAAWLLLRRPYDVIHSHEEAAFLAIILSRLFRTYHVYDMHSSLPRQLENFNFGNVRPVVRLFESLEALALKTCDVVITVGDDLEARVRAVSPQAMHHKIENISLYTEYRSAPETLRQLRKQWNLENCRVVVYTGTFESYQGLPLLLESAQIVCRAMPDVRFLLVGGTPEQIGQLRQQARRRQLEKCLHFTGTVSPEQALDYAAIADLLVSPRIQGTSIPLKIYSYLSAGKPIVATRITAHTQVLTNDTALLVDVNRRALAEGIMHLLGDPGRGAEMGQQAQQSVQDQHSLQNLIPKVEAAYTLLQLARRHAPNY